MMNPKVSVIMPVYNNERYVGEAIQSVLNQTYNNIELIIINDASTDNSYRVIKPFLKNKKIKYYSFNKNKGVSSARNKGLRMASGKFISFLDSDDMWMRNKVKDQVSFMISKNISFSYCLYSMIDENKKHLKVVNELPKVTTQRSILFTNSIPILTVMINANIVKLFSFPHVHHEDYALWLSIFRNRNIKAYLLSKPLAKYRIHKNSISSNKIQSCMWVWYLYRQYEHFSLIKSVLCFIGYAINGLLKHQSIV